MIFIKIDFGQKNKKARVKTMKIKMPDLNRVVQKMVGSVKDRLTDDIARAAIDLLKYLRANTPKGVPPDNWRVQVNGVNVSAHNRRQIFSVVKKWELRKSVPIDIDISCEADEEMQKAVDSLIQRARGNFFKQAGLNQ